MKNQIYPCLWVSHPLHEIITFYQQIIECQVISQSPMVAICILQSQKIMFLHGQAPPSPSDFFSFVLPCETQDEIDKYWDALGQEGQYSQCGWLKDKFGISWQIIPVILPELMKDPDSAVSVIEAFLPMKKLEIRPLVEAAKRHI